MNIDPLAEEYAYNSTYAFQENKMGLGRELEGLELEPLKATWYAAVKSSWNPENGNTDVAEAIGKFIGSFFTPVKADKQKANNKPINTELHTDSAGDEGEKSSQTAKESMNVTAVVENMGSFAGLPGGKSKNGMTNSKKAATSVEKMKENVELFKESGDALESYEKGTNAVLVEFVPGYRSVVTKDVTKADAKKDSAKQAKKGYKVIIERQ